MSNERDVGLKASVFAALALAFASFGDAFLYPFLPLNFLTVGLPVLWVGLILSINRFVRILSNAFMVHAFSRYGLRSVMVVSVVLAIASTFGYGLATGVLSWVALRIMWGLAFSAMRIGVLGYAFQHQRHGFSFGLSRSLQEAGPMLSLFMAPILITNLDSSGVFYFLSVLSLPALYFAWRLPDEDDKSSVMDGRKFLSWPSTLNSVTLVSAMVVDGIIVVVLGMLFLRYRSEINLVIATALAASYLGYRRICLVALSVAGGYISDRIGIERIFNITLALMILGLLAIVSGWIGTGVLIVFTFYSINSAISPGYAVRNSQSLAAIAENATWRDIGAATGTLLGGALISSQYLNTVLTVAAVIMVSLLMAQLGASWKTFRLFYLWK